MIMTTLRERLFVSLGHSFAILSCEVLLRWVDALYLAATLQKTKKIISLSMQYHFTVIPGQKLSKHSVICAVHFVPGDFTNIFFGKFQTEIFFL